MKPHNTLPLADAARESATNMATDIGGRLTGFSTAGWWVEFDPDDAEQAGAFLEEALSEQDAVESTLEAPHGVAQLGDGWEES